MEVISEVVEPVNPGTVVIPDPTAAEVMAAAVAVPAVRDVVEEVIKKRKLICFLPFN